MAQHNATIVVPAIEAEMVEKMLDKNIPFIGHHNVAFRTQFKNGSTICIDISRFNNPAGEPQVNINVTVFDDENSFIDGRIIDADTVFNRSIVVPGRNYDEKYILVITIR